MEGEIHGLRNLAPDWSLAGDKKLLDVLQTLHQRIVTRCEETNKKLEQMVTALDDASIHLQNVNNKFMALSNTQFVESRVYDDDEDITTQTNLQKPAAEKASINPPSVRGENAQEDLMSSLAASVRVLDDMHEAVLILPDSDSDSDSDQENNESVVLKLKDVYAHRPLPYIIGSWAWKNKWHAGLVVDDSDSESDSDNPVYKQTDKEQYSDSEPESLTGRRDIASQLLPPAPPPPPPAPSAPPPAPAPAPAPATPADIAAELARKLAAHAPVKVSEPEPELPQNPVVRKTYRPERPGVARIFSDEPPPLEDTSPHESEGEGYSEEEDDDIFAQLRTEAKQNLRDRAQKQRSELSNKNDDVAQHTDNAKRKPTSSEDKAEPDLFKEKQQTTNTIQQSNQTKDILKKPVGGISLFGSSQGAGSIGAAILKRNQRKSSSDEGNDEPTQSETVPSEISDKKPKQSDIFDDLFAKSSQTNKNVGKNKVEPKAVAKANVTSKVTEKSKVDLFNDNLFDDIDDIFTSNVVKTTTKSNDKSILDDDELFADVAVEKQISTSKKVTKDTQSIFDSDDDLFNDNISVPSSIAPTAATKSSNDTGKVIDKIYNTDTNKSLFGDDDSGEDMFSTTEKKLDDKTAAKTEPTYAVPVKETKSIFGDSSDDDMFSNVKTTTIETYSTKHTEKESQMTKNKIGNVKSKENIAEIADNKRFEEIKPIQKHFHTKSSVVIDETPEKQTDDVFEDEDEWEEKTTNHLVEDIKQINNLVAKDNNNTEKFSPSIFDDDDDIDDLFGNINPVTNLMKPEETKNNHEVDNTALNFKNIKSINNLTSSSDSGNQSITTNSNVLNTAASRSSLKNEFNEDDIVSKKENTIKNVADNLNQPNREKHETVTEISKKCEAKPDNVNSLDVNKNVTEDEVLFSTIQSSLLNKSDDFTDIFVDQPPDFEKPKEPKRSKNVNALFDDDSDDEALFFKKSDPILDEKTQDLDTIQQDQLFGVFHDEPPEIDPDSDQILIDSDVEKNNLRTSDIGNYYLIKSENDIQEDISNQNINDVIVDKVVALENDDFGDDIFKNTETKPRFESVVQVQIESKKVEDSKSVESMIEDAENLDKETKIQDTEPRKAVGKLKPMNFNINVNALVPGASPKKTQKTPEAEDKTDGNVITAVSNEELNVTDKVVEEAKSKLVKSVSFDGNPDSSVLDNKLSKERAKIQVKRRPSTRRARKEAVRKSAIDVGDDSTDNSSSIDDVRSAEIVKDNIVKVETKVEGASQKESVDNELKKEKFENIIPKQAEISEVNTQQITKTVYILNDEDIFPKTKADDKKTVSDIGKPKTLTIVDVDDDDLFKTCQVKAKKEKNVEAIATLGNIYTDINKTTTKPNEISNLLLSLDNQKLVKNDKGKEELKAKPSLFSDSSDDELFGAVKKQKETKPKEIFDNDSDDSLFTSRSRFENSTTDKKKEVSKVVVKKSLFGDDDDDDDGDLFGGNSRKVTVPKEVPIGSTAKESALKLTKPEFKDPLSMLGDIDN